MRAENCKRHYGPRHNCVTQPTTQRGGFPLPTTPWIAYMASLENSPIVPLTVRLQQDQEFSIPGFTGRDFAKSQDPGILQDRISREI